MADPTKISHDSKMIADIGKFLEDDEFSDVVFVLDNEQRFHCHRQILAARNEYFRRMFQKTGMRESSEKEVSMKETPAEAFKALLCYLYTGGVNLAVLEFDTIMDLFQLANKHLVPELEKAIFQYFKKYLNLDNICGTLKAPLVRCIPSFLVECLYFVDQNAPEFLKSTDFKSLSSDFLDSLLQRDSFDAEEDEIFDAVVQWIEANSDLSKEEHKRILENLRLHQVSQDKLKIFAAKTGLLTEREIKRASPRCSEPTENVATYEKGAKVIAGTWMGGSIDAFLDGKTEIFTKDHKVYCHDVNQPKESITIELSRPYVIGSVRFLLWDLNPKCWFSYYVDTSLNGTDWTRVVDKTQEECKSWQDLTFTPLPLQFIKIVGTRSNFNYLNVFYFECPSTNQ